MFWFIRWLFVGMIGIIAVIVITGFAIFKVTDFPKDSMLNSYNKVIEFFGDDSLTSDKKLKGNREFGIDKYVGTYKADYHNFTSEEIIFGGTTLHRKNGDHITLKIVLEKQSGNIDVINKLGNNEISLISDTGEYEETIYIDGMSYYLTIKLDNFKGKIEIIAE